MKHAAMHSRCKVRQVRSKARPTNSESETTAAYNARTIKTDAIEAGAIVVKGTWAVVIKVGAIRAGAIRAGAIKTDAIKARAIHVGASEAGAIKANAI